jgi:hypothetical protein
VAARRGVMAGREVVVLVMCFSLETGFLGQTVMQATASVFRVKGVAQGTVFQCETAPTAVNGWTGFGDLEQTFRKVRPVADSFAAGSRKPQRASAEWEPAE